MRARARVRAYRRGWRAVALSGGRPVGGRGQLPSYLDPHVVTLVAAIDNRLLPETLPLAPWY